MEITEKTMMTHMLNFVIAELIFITFINEEITKYKSYDCYIRRILKNQRNDWNICYFIFVTQFSRNNFIIIHNRIFIRMSNKNGIRHVAIKNEERISVSLLFFFS